MTQVEQRERSVKSRRVSAFKAGLEWTKGSLNDSSYRAFCRYAGALFSVRPAHVLKEVASLIEAAGDTVKKDKLVEQFVSAFAFIANECAAETLGVPLPGSQRVPGHRTGGKWPSAERALIEGIVKTHGQHTLAWWENASPANASMPGDVLPVLFPPGSLICFGPRKDVHLVRVMDEQLLGEVAPSVQYVVPSPICVGFIIPEGKRSPKCNKNFPRRQFVIIEFDREKIDPESKRSVAQLLDLQSALHAHLAERWKALSLLVFSGNTSLHGWYPCAGVDEERVITFLRYACRLGADHYLSSPAQFTRMPGGTHENGNRQSIHYFKAQ